MEAVESSSGQGERLISRGPSWPAAPDHELGKGQPPRGRGRPVRAEGAPKGVLVRSIWAARSMRAQQAPGTRPWPQDWGVTAAILQCEVCAKHFPAVVLIEDALDQVCCLVCCSKPPFEAALAVPVL